MSFRRSARCVRSRTTPQSGSRGPALPAGAHVIKGGLASSIGLAMPDGTARLADVLDLNLTDPVTHGMVLLRTGRLPARAGEAHISPSLARAFHLHVGDTLRLATPEWTERIV